MISFKHFLIKGHRNRTIGSLAKKHGVSADVIVAQLEKGKEVEKEHTDDPRVAKHIAMDHVSERPDYYDRLKKIEKGDK